MQEVIDEYLKGRKHSLPLETYAEAIRKEPMLCNIVFTRLTYDDLLVFKRALEKLVKDDGQLVPYFSDTAMQAFAPYQWRFGALLPYQRMENEARIHVGGYMTQNCVLNIAHLHTSPYKVYEPVHSDRITKRGKDNFTVFIDYDIPGENLQRQLYPRWKDEETITAEEFDNIKKGMIYYTMSKEELDGILHKYDLKTDSKYDPHAIIKLLGSAKTPAEFIKKAKAYDPLIVELKPVIKMLWQTPYELLFKLKSIYNI